MTTVRPYDGDSAIVRWRHCNNTMTIVRQYDGDIAIVRWRQSYNAIVRWLYDRAHKRRDVATRKEDLVKRFLDGLRDEDVRWEVEYVKEPRDIDEAVFNVVNYIQTRKRHQIGSNRRQRPVRRTGGTETDETHSENESDLDIVEYAFRVPNKRQVKCREKTETKRKEIKQ
ncbi:hypothetical protein DPMN_031866 [Dreissena polymorpha]|uniref:Uncharacterized protein n=1 Tax=Dreissena polymorpha TaxID=45954 RepID=A0A9D4M2X1_DREPO|nr:hypothetical protein DPMN_031866 [Dreissena polymorpha]